MFYAIACKWMSLPFCIRIWINILLNKDPKLMYSTNM